ncbi:antiterminator LoaP [Paenibacillus albidus]|uniref:antiterminator LoaP n=1 Tax=Paenibacillus albidus TaxID=2041023 RepID=UPI001BEBAEE3|nr:antiterminator LoaP [Paenibacillus albidus]MBT2288308.1 antiterminator LoaP [Paenibacillus albidus]
MSWYVLYVKSGSESQIKKWIEAKFNRSQIYSVIPKRKVPQKKAGQEYDVVKPLFPGYIFVETKMNFSTYYQLRENPLIYQTLNYNNLKDRNMRSFDTILIDGQAETLDESYFFKEIPMEEMFIVLNLMQSNDIIEYSQVCIEDSKVIVKSGPLKGMERFIKKIDKHKKRAKVLLTILGSELLIDFGIEFL